MKIGPVDIRNHVFQRKMRGVDEAEVRAYLDLVADQLEATILETDDLKGRIDRLEREIEEFRRLERTLRDSLVSAEKISDERLAHAEKEARIILKNAEVDAEKIVQSSREQVGRIRGEIDDLRRQRVTYLERFRALLRSQGKILEASAERFDADDPEVETSPIDAVDAYLGEDGLFTPPTPPTPATPAMPRPAEPQTAPHTPGPSTGP